MRDFTECLEKGRSNFFVPQKKRGSGLMSLSYIKTGEQDLNILTLLFDCCFLYSHTELNTVPPTTSQLLSFLVSLILSSGDMNMSV